MLTLNLPWFTFVVCGQDIGIKMKIYLQDLHSFQSGTENGKRGRRRKQVSVNDFLKVPNLCDINVAISLVIYF